MKILLLEDNILTGMILAELLTEEGHIVDHVTTAADAVDAINSVQPDVGIFDILLEHGTSQAAVDRANEVELPVVLTSGMIDSNDLERLPNKAAFVRKPATVQSLQSALAEITA